MAIDRKKTSLYLDRQLVQTTKMIALNTGKHEYEIIEEALREYVDARREDARRDALTLLDEVADRHEREGASSLTDDETMAMVIKEINVLRAERPHAQPG